MLFELVGQHGAVAEQLGSGLQDRVHRCESGPRLHSATPFASWARLWGYAGTGSGMKFLRSCTKHLLIEQRRRRASQE